jgi:hypothetical protein
VVDFPDEASTLEEILAFHRTHVVRVVKGTAVLEPPGVRARGGTTQKNVRVRRRGRPR